MNEEVRKRGIEYVVKVFKKGTFLQDLQLQVPRGYLAFRAEIFKSGPNAVMPPRFQSGVVRGILLEDGRFAFLMVKEHFDLRFLIERNMESQSSGGKGPFSKEDAEMILYQVALGLGRLHTLNIIHRDVKASNVLVKENKNLKFVCHIADFECSVGVQGTGFFRAPEILQACKNQVLGEKPGVFSKAADIYSYGMTCYEILTGKYPFEGHRLNEYDLVLGGQRPMIPEYVEGWTRELLNRCWQSNPANRLGFGEVLDLFLANPMAARKYEKFVRMNYGQNSRFWLVVKERRKKRIFRMMTSGMKHLLKVLK